MVGITTINKIQQEGVWKKSEGSTWRTKMIMDKGSLREVGLETLIQGISEAGKTGILNLTGTEGWGLKRIYFENGRILFAASNLPDDRLGEFLLRVGKITQAQYDISVKILKEEINKKTGKRQGTILVEQGFIKPEDLVWGVKHQVKEIIISLFVWEDGAYEFKEGTLPTDEVIKLFMKTDDIIREGLNKKREKVALGFIPNGDPLTLNEGATGIKEEIETKTEEAAQAETSRTGVSPVYEETKIEEAASKGPREDEDIAAFKKKIRDRYEMIKDKDHYVVLGVSPDDSIKDIQKAYHQLAKEYHPDRHPDELKEDLDLLFGRISEAYHVLKNKKRREDYDLSLSPKKFNVGRSEDLHRAEDLFKRARQELKEGNYWGAVETLKWTIRLNPKKAIYHSYLGHALSNIPRRMREAEESFKKAIELEPTNPEYYTHLGLLYQKVGLTQRAKAEFYEALKWNPEYQMALDALKEITKGKGMGLLRRMFVKKKGK